MRAQAAWKASITAPMSSGSSRAESAVEWTIADHHGQVTPLAANRRGVVAPRIFCGFARDGHTGRAACHRFDGPDETFPVAQRNPRSFSRSPSVSSGSTSVSIAFWTNVGSYCPDSKFAAAANVHGSALIPFRTPGGCH